MCTYMHMYAYKYASLYKVTLNCSLMLIAVYLKAVYGKKLL